MSGLCQCRNKHFENWLDTAAQFKNNDTIFFFSNESNNTHQEINKSHSLKLFFKREKYSSQDSSSSLT